MNRKNFIYKSISVVIMLLGLQLNSEPVSKIEFIEKALENQESLASSPGLYVKYSVEGYKNGKKAPGKIEAVYIKTLDSIFLNQKTYLNNALIFTTSTLYERKNDRWKSISTYCKTNESAGAIGSGIPSSFSTLDIMETNRYSIPGFGNNLLKLIQKRKLKIANESEVINGHKTFLLTPSVQEKDIKHCKIYLDPQIDFCPYLIDVKRTSISHNIKFQNYKDIGNKVYFPYSIQMFTKDEEGEMEKLFTVKEASAGKKINENISIEFPSGTEVYDENTGQSFKVK